MKKEDVTHRGLVRRVEGNSLTVETDEQCSCDGCAVAAICNKSGADEPKADGAVRELITVSVPDASMFKPGDRVELAATSGSTLWATVWALIVPTVVFAGVLLGVRLGFPQAGDWSIAAAFVALALYTAVLWLFRNALAGKIVWQVRRV